MQKDKFVFAQLTDFLDYEKFKRCTLHFHGNAYVKFFSCWQQLLALIFGQLSKRESMRDLVLTLESHRKKMNALGMGKNVSRSNLSKANRRRDARIFEEFAFFMAHKAHEKALGTLRLRQNRVFAFDSTTIKLSLSLFPWTKARCGAGGVKEHTLLSTDTMVPTFFLVTAAHCSDMSVMDKIPFEPDAIYVFDRGYNSFRRLFLIREIGSFFVLRAREDLAAETVEKNPVSSENVLADEWISLRAPCSRKLYPERIRRIVFFDEELRRTFTFLSNLSRLSAEEIAGVYKRRWQIELFFKWLKQHLKLKRFWGNDRNALHIQIYTAIITYCLISIVRSELKIERSLYEMLQVLSASLTDKTPLRTLFEKSNFSDTIPNPEEDPALELIFSGH